MSGSPTRIHSTRSGRRGARLVARTAQSAAAATEPTVHRPMGEDFDYGAESDTLDREAVRADLNALFVDSQDWWPADFGNYAPFFIRMAWRAAGTYRTEDGRGGAGHAMQRFTPPTAGPTTPTSTRPAACSGRSSRSHGRKLSWADLMEFTGNCALESMGFETMGSAADARTGGRATTPGGDPNACGWRPASSGARTVRNWTCRSRCRRWG